MKTHKEREGGDGEGDQSMTVADVEQSCRKKEKKMKKKKKNLHLMTSNSEVEEDGNEEAAMDANEEMEKDDKLKKKVKTGDVMMSDETERKEEKKKKKKEKRDQVMLSNDKEKKELIGDAELEQSELRSDSMKADGEGDKGEKDGKRKRKEKERNSDKAVHEEQNTPNDTKEKKKRKRDQMMDDKETRVDAVVSGSDGREVDQNKSRDDIKADDGGDKGEKERKRKQKVKERNSDKAVHEEQNTPSDTREKKKRKRDQVMDDNETRVDAVASGSDGREMEQNKLRDDMKADNDGNKGEKKKMKKKRKEKETKGGVVLHEEQSTGNEQKESKKGKVNGMKGGKSDNKEKEKKKEMEAGEAADSSENVIPKRRSKRVKFSDEVTVFPPPSEGKKVRKKPVRPDDAEALEELQGKKFTKEEDEMILKAVADYIDAKQLGEQGLDMVLHCHAHRELMGCWAEIRKALPWRYREAIYNRAHSLLERGDKGTWTPEQVEFVMESHRKNGANWRQLSEEMGKYRIHVKDAYRRYKLANRKKGHWSQDEYQTLFELVSKDLQMKVYEERRSKHGMLRDDISWEAISDKLGTRNQVTCVKKWYHQLRSPMVDEGEWADVDDYMLLMELVELDASCEEEVDWDSLLEHRSGYVCHKRWTQMTLHLGEHGNKSFSEQVEILSNRYCPYLLETRQQLDARPIVD